MTLTFLLYHVLLVAASMSFMIPSERMIFHLTRLDQTLFPTKKHVWLACLVGKIVRVLDCNISQCTCMFERDVY